MLEQTLPKLESAWTTVEITSSNKEYSFKRETNKSKVFSISGYIQLSTWAATRAEAEGLNTALNSDPSGVFTDGYGTTYSCLVDDWEISPVAAMNKYNFNMDLRIV